MHLDIGLPLRSELEQLSKTFWQNHNIQDNIHDSHEQTHCSQPQRQSPDPDNTNNHTESNHLTQSQDQDSIPDSHSDGQQNMQDNHSMRTEQVHSCLKRECINYSQDESQCCRTMTDAETCKHENHSGQENIQHEPSQPLQDNSSDLDQSNRHRRTCRALWDRSTEDSSFL